MWEWWKKNRPFILSGMLLLVVLLFYSVNLQKKDETNFLENLVLRVTGPVQLFVDRSIETVADIWGHYIYLVETEQENLRLLKANRSLRASLEGSEEIRLENERLKHLLDFKEKQDIQTLPARVIAEDATSWFRTITINKGTDQGLVEGMPVVVPEGVVGRVVRTSPNYSRVLLVTDASSAVASLIQDNRARGLSRGNGESLSFDFVLRQEAINVGDRVITSGMGGVFPKGLTVGQVQTVNQKDYGLFQEILVAPAVDFSHLEEVLVLLRGSQ